MKLKGKVALITGASRNIGRAIAIAMAQEGGDIVVNTRKSHENLHAVAKEIESFGVNALPVVADVSDPEAVKQMMKRVEAEFDRVDILVNNAVQRLDRPFVDMTFEQWRSAINVNLNGFFNCTSAVIPGMIRREWGRIINFSGISASIGMGSRAAISTVKAGVVGFTKSLAREFGPFGITVNSISPGDIDVVRDPGHNGGKSSRNLPPTVELTALRRIGTTEEISSLCAYLSTDLAGYITGQNIGVNGGAYM